MTKLMYTRYDTFCNICGVSEGSRQWDNYWWNSLDDETHICSSCQDIVRKALAIEEFKREQLLVVNLDFYVSETAEQIEEEVLCMKAAFGDKEDNDRD